MDIAKLIPSSIVQGVSRRDQQRRVEPRSNPPVRSEGEYGIRLIEFYVSFILKSAIKFGSPSLGHVIRTRWLSIEPLDRHTRLITSLDPHTSVGESSRH